MALEVELAPPGLGNMLERTWAILDTGSDLSAIPRRVIGLFGLQPADEVLVADATGEARRHLTYNVNVSIGELGSFVVRANGTAQQFAILGLDILNSLVLTANGPEGWFELALPARTS